MSAFFVQSFSAMQQHLYLSPSVIGLVCNLMIKLKHFVFDLNDFWPGSTGANPVLKMMNVGWASERAGASSTSCLST
jgi:hypothetical protein